MELPTLLRKQKTNRERSLFRKTKTKQMERCNPPRFKTNRQKKGSGNPAIPYFECFTTAAICQNQSERSVFYGTKNQWSVIATLQKLEGILWYTQGLCTSSLEADTVILLLDMKMGAAQGDYRM